MRTVVNTPQPRRLAAWLASLCLLVLPTAQAAPTLTILPGNFTLNGPPARQQLLLEWTENERFIGPVTNAPTFSSSRPEVVKIADGVAIPLANGVTTLRAEVAGREASVDVMVTGMEKPFRWNFRNHVQPVLAKTGCSSGACHGAAAGQNGFKLSLRGYDEQGDFQAITRHALGRRVVPADPGRSLLLLKPTGAIPHKGGARFDTESMEYRVLSEWIAAGTPGPSKDDPRIQRLEILPEHVILQPGAQQPLLVRAHFSDGQVEDVTRWVKYTDAHAAVTQVDETGKVKVMGYGEGAITAWYLSRIAIATVSAPYTNVVAPNIFAQAPRRNFIDDRVLEKLQELNLPPSSPATDAEFIRRVFLDTIGLPPTAQETRAFLASREPDKRDAVIEGLLKRPEFVDYWSYKWSDLLLVNTEKLPPAAMATYYQWIRNNVAANTPWDLFVRRLVTAKGSNLENGAANYYVLHEDPTEMAETTSQAFLGMAVNCAKCHNHPMEKWTNDEYFGYANLFARVRSKTGVNDADRIIFVSAQGDLNQPLRGRPQPPRPLEGKPLSLDDPGDRREALADWLTSGTNPYFARAIVNRVWANFMSVGLVVNVDDLRMTNPASNEKLLSAMAHYLVEQKFDLKALLRAILQSTTYQRSSLPLPGNAADQRFYSHYYPRRLKAEVLLDALSQVTGAPTKFPNYPEGWRALQLPDSNVKSYFLETFGRPSRLKTCECERTAEPSVTQVLHLANGDTINQKLAAKDNLLEKLLHPKPAPEQIIEEAWLGALSRFPTDTEKSRLLKVLNEPGASPLRPVVEDLYWALLSSKEFLFNH